MFEFAFTTVRRVQDAKLEEDYVALYLAAAQSSGARARRLFGLAGVTYSEWVGLGQRGDAAAFAWILSSAPAGARLPPADLAELVALARSTMRPVTRLASTLPPPPPPRRRRADPDDSDDDEFGFEEEEVEDSRLSAAAEYETLTVSALDRIAFRNGEAGDGAVLVAAAQAVPGELVQLDVGNLPRLSAEALYSALSTHGEFLNSLALLIRSTPAAADNFPFQTPPPTATSVLIDLPPSSAASRTTATPPAAGPQLAGPSGVAGPDGEPGGLWVDEAAYALQLCGGGPSGGAFGRLRTLRLEGLVWIPDDAGSRRLAEALPMGLTSLSLRAASFLRDTIIRAIKRCPELEELDISGCERVDEEVGLHIAHRLPRLAVLRAAGCPSLSSVSVAEIAFRTRRVHPGPPGRRAPLGADGRRAGEHLYDEPELHLVGLVLRDQAERRERQWTWDPADDLEEFDWGDLAPLGDTEAERVLRESERMRLRQRAQQQKAWEKELARLSRFAQVEADFKTVDSIQREAEIQPQNASALAAAALAAALSAATATAISPVQTSARGRRRMSAVSMLLATKGGRRSSLLNTLSVGAQGNVGLVHSGQPVPNSDDGEDEDDEGEQQQQGVEADDEEDEPTTLQDVAVRLGLEDREAREARLQAVEQAAEARRRAEREMAASDRFLQGDTDQEAAERSGMELVECQVLRGRWEAVQRGQHRELRIIPLDELVNFVPVFRITQVLLRQAFASGLPSSSRLYLAVKCAEKGNESSEAGADVIRTSPLVSPNSAFPVVMESFLPRLPADLGPVWVEMRERLRDGSDRPLASFTVPLRRYADGPPELFAYPLFGTDFAGAWCGAAIGKFYIDLRVLSRSCFDFWRRVVPRRDELLEGDEETEELKIGHLAGPAQARRDEARRRRLLARAEEACERVMKRVVAALIEEADPFQPFRCLRILDVGRCLLMNNSAVIETARSFPTLEELSLAGVTSLSDKALLFVGRLLPSLRKLDITGAVRVTDSGIEAVAEGCGWLEDLCMDGCRTLSDAAIQAVLSADRRGRLTRLSILTLPRTSPATVLAVAGSPCAPNLQAFAVTGGAMHGDEVPLAVAANCPSLARLDLEWCVGLSDRGVASLSRAQFAVSLTRLSLAYCESIGTRGVMALATSCPMMCWLDLTACAMLEDPGVRAVARGMLRLAKLKLSLCERLTPATLVSLADWAESLTYVELLGCAGLGLAEVARFRQRVGGRMLVVADKDKQSS